MGGGGGVTINTYRKEFEKVKCLFDVNIGFCINCHGKKNLQLHHIVPLAIGGTNTYENIVWVCGKCHSKIHNKSSLLEASRLIKEGIQRAKEKGVRLGRPTATLPKDFKYYYDKWKQKEITAVKFAKLLGVGRATLYRHIKLYEDKVVVGV
jgi:hypothetical protein